VIAPGIEIRKFIPIARRAISKSPEKQWMIPPVSEAFSSSRMESVSAWASRSWTITGRLRRRASRICSRKAWRWRSRGERSRWKSSPVSPIATTLSHRESASSRSSVLSEQEEASCGCWPTAA